MAENRINGKMFNKLTAVLLFLIFINGCGPSLQYTRDENKLQNKAKIKKESKSIMMTGEGSGISREDSIKAALRDSIEKSLGVFISAKTLTENNRLISDKILAYSRGYIENFEVLNETRENDLVKIKVLAEIKPEQLISNLSSIGCIEISGETYIYDAKLEIERKKIALKIMKEILGDTLKNGFKYEISKPEFSTDLKNEQTTSLMLLVRGVFKKDIWKIFEKVLRKFEIDETNYYFTMVPDMEVDFLKSRVALPVEIWRMLKEELERTSFSIIFCDNTEKDIFTVGMKAFHVDTVYMYDEQEVLYATPKFTRIPNGFLAKFNIPNVPFEKLNKVKYIKAEIVINSPVIE